MLKRPVQPSPSNDPSSSRSEHYIGKIHELVSTEASYVKRLRALKDVSSCNSVDSQTGLIDTFLELCRPVAQTSFETDHLSLRGDEDLRQHR